MNRQARLDAPGATHHVTIRGIEGRDIFHDDLDRLDFLRRLLGERLDAAFVCLAWALMSNHVHLVLRTGAVPLSKFMQRLNGGYALAFNRRYQRTGYLLQDRFHSSPILDDAYRSVAVRYVFLNPLRAGIVPSVAALETYPWTGYSELTGKHPRGIIAAGEVLQWLAPVSAERGGLLADWVGAVADVDLGPVGRTPARVGHESRTRRVSGSPGDAEPKEVRVARHRARGWTLPALIKWTAAKCDASEGLLRAGRRFPAESRARALVSVLASDELGIDLGTVAAATGVTPAAITQALRRGDQIVRTENISLPAVPPEE